MDPRIAHVPGLPMIPGETEPVNRPQTSYQFVLPVTQQTEEGFASPPLQVMASDTFADMAVGVEGGQQKEAAVPEFLYTLELETYTDLGGETKTMTVTVLNVASMTFKCNKCSLPFSSQTLTAEQLVYLRVHICSETEQETHATADSETRLHPLSSETSMEVIQTGQRLEPSYAGSHLEPRQTASQLEPMHTGSRLEPMHTGLRLEPIHTGSKLVPMHTGSQLEPVHTVSQLEPMHTVPQLEPMHAGSHLEAKYRGSTVGSTALESNVGSMYYGPSVGRIQPGSSRSTGFMPAESSIGSFHSELSTTPMHSGTAVGSMQTESGIAPVQPVPSNANLQNLVTSSGMQTGWANSGFRLTDQASSNISASSSVNDQVTPQHLADVPLLDISGIKPPSSSAADLPGVAPPVGWNHSNLSGSDPPNSQNMELKNLNTSAAIAIDNSHSVTTQNIGHATGNIADKQCLESEKSQQSQSDQHETDSQEVKEEHQSQAESGDDQGTAGDGPSDEDKFIPEPESSPDRKKSTKRKKPPAKKLKKKRGLKIHVKETDSDAEESQVDPPKQKSARKKTATSSSNIEDRNLKQKSVCTGSARQLRSHKNAPRTNNGANRKRVTQRASKKALEQIFETCRKKRNEGDTDVDSVDFFMGILKGEEEYSEEQKPPSVSKESIGTEARKTRKRKKKYENVVLECSTCGMVFKNNRGLIQHQIIHFGGKPHECATCGKAFKRKSTLEEHMLTHGGERRFLCDICGRKFLRKSDHTAHIRSHNNDLSCKCPECGKSCKGQVHLQLHRRKHTSERPFLCTTCGETFKYPLSLQSHMRMHKVAENPLQCSECDKIYADVDDLRLHDCAAGKKHLCSVCGKLYTQPAGLRAHMKSHMREKPSECQYCHVTFMNELELQRHKDNNMIMCSGCSKNIKAARSCMLDKFPAGDLEGKTFLCWTCHCNQANSPVKNE